MTSEFLLLCIFGHIVLVTARERPKNLLEAFSSRGPTRGKIILIAAHSAVCDLFPSRPHLCVSVSTRYNLNNLSTRFWLLSFSVSREPSTFVQNAVIK